MRLRRVGSVALTCAALLVLAAGLAVPDEPAYLSWRGLVQLPLELLVLLALALVLRPPVRGVVLGVAGALLGLTVLVKALDMALLSALYRTFDPLSDPSYAGSAVGVLEDSIGHTGAVLATVAVALAGVGVLVAMPAAAVRLSRVVGRHRRSGTVVLAAGAALFLLSTVRQWEVVPGRWVASADTASVAATHVGQVSDGIRERGEFEQEAARDPYAGATDLLQGLRGKDVVIVFVESYGRSAVEDPSLAPTVDAALDRGATSLASTGFSARTAYLTSPTFGGLSWLAHSTLHTGLRISDQVRYNAAIASSRMTLSAAFKAAGWRTVLDAPADEQDWTPAASFYRYDTVYDARNVGYAGPAFGYATVPDQYTLQTLARRELGPGPRAPVMAEVDLVSSHTPWAPLPRLVPASELGDGSIYASQLQEAPTAATVWRDPAAVRQAYAHSIAYSLDAVTSFVAEARNPNLVVLMLGDHQPATVITGEGASHDVPVTVLAHDTGVLDRVAGWGWTPGLRPGSGAPVWPMDSLRDRFLAAFAS